ncbi:MAG: PD-(D/E)XK motif protein [Acidobacteriota bacterium]
MFNSNSDMNCHQVSVLNCFNNLKRLALSVSRVTLILTILPYSFADHEYEIKTIRTGANRVLISSAEQLDLQINLLDMVIVLLDDANPGSHPDVFTPLDLVERLRASMQSAPAALEIFEARLIEVGFITREEYGERGYIFRQFRTFRVEEGFPAIRRSQLPVGIGKVSYELEVPAILPFERTPAIT